MRVVQTRRAGSRLYHLAVAHREPSLCGISPGALGSAAEHLLSVRRKLCRSCAEVYVRGRDSGSFRGGMIVEGLLERGTR